jgi:hypothetical protein
MKDYEVSPRMKLQDALKWIIEHDIEKSKSWRKPQKIKNWKKEFDLETLF